MLGAFGAGAAGSVAATAAGLFIYGVGTSVWDVAMNVEGARVEQRLGRTIMPRFHAGWSLGTIAGAGIGVLITALQRPVLVHLAGRRRARAGAAADGRRPAVPAGRAGAASRRPPVGRSAWLEPRTLAIGLMVLAFAAAEGSANDWLTLAIIDGHDVAHWVGVARLRAVRHRDDDRPDGRAAVAGPLRPGAGAVGDDGRRGGVGILLVVLGAPLVGHRARHRRVGSGRLPRLPGRDERRRRRPARAAARVSVVSTLGYSAFLAGPPLLGQLADRVGTLDALLAIAVLMIPAALSVFAVRPPRR